MAASDNNGPKIPPDTLVIGVGNRFRSDDAAGVLVADRLRAQGYSAVEMSGEGASLIEAWNPEQTVVLIDAAASGAVAGTVHRFDASTSTVPTGLFHYSSHQFAVAEAVEMARVLGRLPKRLIVYGIEGAFFGYGEAVTPNVAGAIVDVAERIAVELGDERHNAKNSW